MEVKNLVKYFPLRDRNFFKESTHKCHAVDGLSFEIIEGESLGLVGESGCGKSTLARLMLALIKPTHGEILYQGKSLLKTEGAALKRIRAEIQIIFQDPYTSLNPRMQIGSILNEPLSIHRIGTGKGRENIVTETLWKVGLKKEDLMRFPHEFSAGQRQRIGIARALILNPKVVVADEPVSALDLSIQAQILNLLADLQTEFNLTLFFISHNINVVRYISSRIVVMYLGKFVEIGDAESLYKSPLHPYSQALIAAVLSPDSHVVKKKKIITGECTNNINLPSGCRFHPRCNFVMPRCKVEEPGLKCYNNKRQVACFLY